MKKIISILMVLLLAGCSAAKEETVVEEETKTEETTNETVEETKDTVEETVTSEEPLEKDYYGTYYGRAQMKIVQVGDVYHVTIHWGDSAFTSVEWAIQIDTTEGVAAYSEAVCDEVTYEESDDPKAVNGYLETFKEIYHDGSGTLTFDNTNNQVTWHSDNVNDVANGDDVVFALTEE